MKQFLLGGLVLFGLISGGVFFNKSTETSERAYTPRDMESDEQARIHGYYEYIKSIRANPATGKVSWEDLAAVRKHINGMSKNKALNLQWNFAGPDDVGGRTRALLIDKTNSNKIWAGGIAGGLFVSTDRGGTWNEFAPLADNLTISSIAQLDNGSIYIGTGSTHEGTPGGTGGSEFPGAGLYKVDVQNTTLIPVLGKGTSVTPPSWGSPSGDYAYINQLVAKGNILYMATGRGLKVYDESLPIDEVNANRCARNPHNPIYLNGTVQVTSTIHDVDVHSNGLVMAAVGGGVWLSPTGACAGGPGDWTQENLSGGRTEIAIAKSNPNYAYAACVSGSGCLSNIWQTRDAGATWQVIGPGGGSFEPYMSANCQGTYDNALDVCPGNEKVIVLGAVTPWKWEESGTPGVGQWTQAASIGGIQKVSPFWMHADQHRVVWEDSANVWVTSDGGIHHSTDGGWTWTHKNSGYNVTTFYSVAITNNGIIAGGTQDNGTQMVGFNSSSNTGLNGLLIRGGDGFDCDFSNLAQSAYSTVYNGALVRHSGSNFVTTTFWDNELDAICNANGDGSGTCGGFYTVGRYWESFNDPYSTDSVKFFADTNYTVGQTVTYKSATSDFITFPFTLTSNLNKGDSILLPDYAQAMYVFDAGSAGIYMTRQAARYDVAPEWDKISNITTATDIEVSKDGRFIWVALGGGIRRISNVELARDSVTGDIRSSGCVLVEQAASGTSGTVTGIAIDPNDPNNVIATVGGYSGGNKVYRCTNGAQAGAPTFTSIQGGGVNALPSTMPVYDAVIDMTDKDRVLLATDWGVFGTENAFTGAVQWTEENTGMAHVPVHEIRQIDDPWLLAPGVSGRVVIGTHGRGFYTTDDIMSTPEMEKDNVITEADVNLSIYPNPTSNFGYFDFVLPTSEQVTYKIYNLKGDLVRSEDLGKLVRGKHNIRFDISGLSAGTYIVGFTAGSTRMVEKIVKMH